MKTLVLAVVLSGLATVNTAFAYAPFEMSFAERLQWAQEHSFTLIRANPLVTGPAADIAALLQREVRLQVDTLHDACAEVAGHPACSEDGYWFCLNEIR